MIYVEGVGGGYFFDLTKGLWKAVDVEIMLKVIIITLTNGLVNSVKLYKETFCPVEK